MRVTCRHCDRRRSLDRRELCRGCYRDEGIRAKYGVSPTYRRGTAEGSGDLDATPTATRPGSLAKMVVMAARAEKGLCLFHPADFPSGATEG